MTRPLNPNAQKWVEALESGDYSQGTRALHSVKPGDPDRLCCLGVACRLAADAGVPLDITTNDGSVHYDGQPAVLPEAVRLWLGLRDVYSSYTDGQRDAQLTEDNDEGATFDEIAQTIRAHADELFVDGAA